MRHDGLMIMTVVKMVMLVVAVDADDAAVRGMGDVRLDHARIGPAFDDRVRVASDISSRGMVRRSRKLGHRMSRTATVAAYCISRDVMTVMAFGPVRMAKLLGQARKAQAKR